MKRETDNKSVAARIMGKIKNAARKVGNVLDDLGDPNKHIDNPDGLKYYEKEGFMEKREAEVNKSIQNNQAPYGDKGIER